MKEHTANECRRFWRWVYAVRKNANHELMSAEIRTEKRLVIRTKFYQDGQNNLRNV
jgi:hypothetical protein